MLQACVEFYYTGRAAACQAKVSLFSDRESRLCGEWVKKKDHAVQAAAIKGGIRLMMYLDKRIQVICNELKREAIRQTVPVAGLCMKRGFFLRPEDAEADPSPFVPFDSATDHWYGPDEHYWFRATVTVPESFDGRSLWLKVCTQAGGWDARNPQFLAFVNGEAAQGMDTNHRETLITREARAGETLRLDIQAYTGTEESASELRLICQLQEISPEIEGLYWDLQVPLSAFSRLDEQSRSRMALENVMNDAINLLDLRTPCSDAYMDSVRAARAYLAEHLYRELGGHDEVVASCIGHTHIDVAWRWTVAQSREKVARSFATVLKLMEEYPHYKFMSSQPQLYVFLKERYPDLYARLKRRVAEGRWEPEGGMWVEADCNLTSGESLVRQFLHGKRFFREEFGVNSRILWLPDVFGYSGALPQIMKECGIEYFMTTKLAWNQVNKMPYDTFRWRGIDGSEILTHLVTTLELGQPETSFYTTYNGQLHPDALIGGWRRYQQKAINNDVLISYGYGDGGGGPSRAMLENSDRLEKGVTGLPKVRQCFAGQYFDELKARVGGSKRLPTWEGELYFEYHRGTLTSMARNKRANRKAELGMMDLELMCVWAADRAEYPAQALDRMWKTILINQFHDILPGSSIHEVYEVTKREYDALKEEIAALSRERLALLAPPSDCVTVFNTKGFPSDETVRLGNVAAAALVDGDGARYPVQQTAQGAVVRLEALPAKGWRTYALSGETAVSACPFMLTDDRHLSTPFYEVELDEDGLISRLFDVEANREVLRPGSRGNLMRMYEDKPMKYDNWDIDVFYTEKFWDATDLQSLRWTEVGEVRATVELERKISRSVIRQRIHFYADTRRIDFETSVDWQEHQHLLKVHFPVDVHTDEATFEIQFGNVKRKTHQNTSWDVARFESCGQKWMDVSEGHYGVSLLNDCKYGHSVTDGVIALTLIKSGVEPNPVADQETHTFTYALYPHQGDWRCGTIQEAYCLNQPALAVHGGRAGSRFSLADTSHTNVMLETIKRAEDGDGWIVRLYETDNARTEAALYWAYPIERAEECNCLEEKKADVAVETTGGDPYHCAAIPFVIRPYEIKTFRIRDKR